MKRHSYPLSLVLLGGLLSLYVGERVVAVGGLRWVFTGLGLLAVLAAVVLRGLRLSTTGSDAAERRVIERWILFLYAGVVGAVAVYLVQSDAVTALGMKVLEDSAPKLATVLAALWPSVLACCLFPLLLVEQSYAAMVRAPIVESGRVREALFSGLGMGFVLVFAFSAYYVANERSTKWDFSYFRTARPGDATKNLARSFTEPVKASLFFPPASEVREEVKGYFTDLVAQTDKLELELLDHAVDVARAKELGVGANGTVVLARGQRKELLSIGTELEKARSQLRNLDKDVHKRLLAVAREKRTVYLVTGHGERSAERMGPTDQRWTIRALREQLQALNYEVKNLGAADGLASEVPPDAAAVLVLGPTRDFMAEEQNALDVYVKRGGRLFVALDPEAGIKLDTLLHTLGVEMQTVLMANDQAYLRREHQESDRINVLTATYSSHPSVTSLGRLGARAPMLLVGAGHLTRISPPPTEARVDTTVTSHVATWNDLDGDFNPDPPNEVRKGWELAAAVTLKSKTQGQPEGRAVVLADSDALTDVVLENAGNYYFLIDGVKWLLGDEELAGELTSEVDVPIEASRKQDVAWFYGSTFLAPALVMGVGFFVTRRRGRRKGNDRRTQESGGGEGPGGGGASGEEASR